MKTSPTTTARRTTLLLAACALACAAALPQASALSYGWGDQVQGSGAVTRQTRAVGHFSGVALSLPGTVEVRIGNTEGVMVETDDNLQPLVETVVEDGTLKIRPARRNMDMHIRTLRVVVQARSIERLALAGSGSINADTLRAPRLQFDIGGSGDINVKNVDSETVSARIGGSGDLKAGGSAHQLSLSLAGSGNADLGQLKAASASVKVAGSGESTVWATGALSVSIAGSGDVSYYGNPTVSRSVMGSGDVRHLGAAPR